MSKVLPYSELATPGHGYIEFLDCEYPEEDAKTAPCAWIDQFAVMLDVSYFYHVDSDETKYVVHSEEFEDYNKISRNTVIAWRIWDSVPTTEEIYKTGWEEAYKTNPSLYYRGQESNLRDIAIM